MMHLARWLFILGVFTTGLRADFARDLARIHAEAVGGRARVEALRAFKATGSTRSGQTELTFVLWAARPNLIRTEVTSGQRTLTQGWDGTGEPWASDSVTRKVGSLGRADAMDFKIDAEFDDPLLAGAGRKISLDYSGEVELAGQKLFKVVVTQNFSETSFVYVDAATFLIVRRNVIRRQAGKEVRIETEYGDFRAVAGVILPHRLVVTKDGKRLHETVIDRMEPNPALPDDLFKRPVVAAAGGH